MAITVGTTASSGNSVFGTIPNPTVTVDATTSVYIAVLHSLSNNTTPSGATLGGVAMTLLYTNTAPNGRRSTFFGLENPPTGSQSIVFSTGSSDWYGFGGYCLIGTDVTSAGGYLGATNTGNGHSVSITTTSANSIIINATGGFTNTPPAPPASGETVGYTDSSDSGNRQFAGAYKLTTTTGSYTTSWSNGANDTIQVIEVKQGAGRTPTANKNGFLRFM